MPAVPHNLIEVLMWPSMPAHFFKYAGNVMSPHNDFEAEEI
jgi:hypothetical protein